MPIDFKFKDIMHKITARFVPATLPNAKKPYVLKVVHKTVLNLHETASKAAIYNITTQPKVIEEGVAAYLELMRYLIADGYKLKTSMFTADISLPGEYDGAETQLAEGTRPKIRLRPSAEMAAYIEKHVEVGIDGIDRRAGVIGAVRDEATGQENETATIGSFITVRGLGLKIEADAAHAEAAGLYFEGEDGARVKAARPAVNEPRTLKTLVPALLQPGKAYSLVIVTQSSVPHGSVLLKDMRSIQSEFTLLAQPSPVV
jgi:hypothetical protein